MALTAAQLQAYWDKNPQELQLAAQVNPSAFTSLALGGHSNQGGVKASAADVMVGRGPGGAGGLTVEQLQQYWSSNPSQQGKPPPTGYAPGNPTGAPVGPNLPASSAASTGASTATGAPAGLTDAQLEEYWAANPEALAAAAKANPAAFAGFGSGTGLAGSEAAMVGGLNNANVSLADGLTGATDAINGGYASAADTLNPFHQEGLSASELQANLSGANGAEAQAQAFQNYQESPEQAWLREQTERGVTRNAAATGGLQGGNVLKALQENAAGLASQDYQNSFNRLGTVADRGFTASGALASMDTNKANTLADLNYNTGLVGADMNFGLGNALGGQRYDAGQRISSNIGNTTNALASLQQNLGAGNADILGADSGNLASIIAAMGESENTNANQLATILANLSTGQGSQVAGLPSLAGLVGTDNSTAQFADSLGSILAAYGQYQNSQQEG